MACSPSVLSGDRESQSGAVETDQGRYIRVDGSASTGSVDSCDGHSGFDHDLCGLTVRAHLRRDETGSFGTVPEPAGRT